MYKKLGRKLNINMSDYDIFTQTCYRPELLN